MFSLFEKLSFAYGLYTSQIFKNSSNEYFVMEEHLTGPWGNFKLYKSAQYLWNSSDSWLMYEKMDWTHTSERLGQRMFTDQHRAHCFLAFDKMDGSFGSYCKCPFS